MGRWIFISLTRIGESGGLCLFVWFGRKCESDFDSGRRVRAAQRAVGEGSGILLLSIESGEPANTNVLLHLRKKKMVWK